MSKRWRNARNHGFTLIEAMIASVIMLLALSSVLALASHSFRYIRDMRASARSSQVLQQKMEDIRLVTMWSNLWALNGTTFVDNTITGMTYNGKITITSGNGPYPTNYSALVSLSVTWTNSVRKVCTNYLTGLVCKNGLNKYIF